MTKIMLILTCAICGEENDDVFHTLRCGHTFHYGCLYTSFKNMKIIHVHIVVQQASITNYTWIEKSGFQYAL